MFVKIFVGISVKYWLHLKIWFEQQKIKLFTYGKKLNVFLVFFIQSYFIVPKKVRLNSLHYFIKKILNRREYRWYYALKKRSIDEKVWVAFTTRVL